MSSHFTPLEPRGQTHTLIHTQTHIPMIYTESILRYKSCTWFNKAFSSKSTTRCNPYFGWYKIYKQWHQPKEGLTLVDVLENALFVVCTCTWLYVFELTVTGWCIMVTYIAGSSWLLVSLLFIVISASFFKFKIFKTRHKSACGQCTPGLKIVSADVCMCVCVCVCVCVSTPKAINS